MSQWIPHVTVATVIEKDGRFLFVEEKTNAVSHPVFNQPAGHVEYGETLIDAAKRETSEETGYMVEIDNLLGIYTYTPPNSPHKTYYRFCFLAHITAQNNSSDLDSDIIRTLWMTLDELKETARARSPLVIKAIQDALSGQNYPLSLIYEHVNLPLNLNSDA